MGAFQPSAKYVKFLVYMVAVVLINVAGATLFYRWDLTENKAYSLSDASKRLVSNLSEPLTIKVFFSKNLPAPYNGTERYLRDLLGEYAAYANTYFNYRFYDVSAEGGDLGPDAGANQKLAENYGIHPIQIQAIEKDEVTFQRAYMGLVMIHGDIIERIPTISDIDGLEYRLTTAVQKLNNKISALLGLKENIRVRLFQSSSLNAVAPLMGLEDLPDLPGRVRETVEEINRKNYGKLTFEYLDPTETPALEAEAKKYGLLELSWKASAQHNIPAGSGVSGLVMSHGEKVFTVPLIQVLRLPLIGTQYTQVGLDQIQEIIDGNLATLIGIHEDLGILTGYGTLNVSGAAPRDPMSQRSDDVNSFRALVQQTYSIRDVDLAERIPDGIRCLVIARPTEKFSDYDLFEIDQFLMQGKSLALFIDSFDEVMPPGPQGMMGGQPQYVAVETGLERLLAHYGVRIKPSYVLDENCFKQRVPERMGGGERDIYFAPLIQNRFIDKELDFMAGIKGLIALKNAPLALFDDRIADNRITARELFSSSERAWELSGRINLNPLFLQPPASEDDFKRYPLAYLLEGEFPSFFADKPIPEKPGTEAPADPNPDADPVTADKTSGADENGPSEETPSPGGDLSATDQPAADPAAGIEGKGTKITWGKPGKIILVGSSSMIQDVVLSEDARNPNAIFVMNVIDELNDREDIAVMRSKEQTFNPLRESSPGVKTLVKAVNIAGLPVLVVLFGLLVWGRRHSRKKQIQLMFYKA